MTIPEIRVRLHEIADEYGVSGEVSRELHYLAEQTRRRPPVRHVRRPHQATPDARLARAIREYARAHPDATMFDIGERFNVNQGRVSEVLGGFRT
jgi:hypothetical protein